MPAETKKILVCDDDDDLRMLVKLGLQSPELDIFEAIDGKEALRLCREITPDVLVLDIRLPGMDGNEVLQRLRAEVTENFLPVLILTALDSVDECVHSLQLGADGYLTKPFELKELKARIHALCRIKELTDSLTAHSRELERANEEISHAQQALIAKEREIVAMQLAATASHHLKQPVTAILLNCHLLKQKLADVSLPAQRQGEVEGLLKRVEDDCAVINSVLESINKADPSRVQDYVGSATVLELDPAASPKT